MDLVGSFWEVFCFHHGANEVLILGYGSKASRMVIIYLSNALKRLSYIEGQLSLHDGTASPCRLSASVSHFQLGVGANNLAVWHGRVDRRDTDQCKARSRSPAQAAI
jgi:hypothetical protein